MTFAIRHAAAIAAFIACATPVHADWEATSWGMSPDAALAALEGAERHLPADSEMYNYDGTIYAPLVKLTHAVEGIEGQITVLFDPDAALRFVTFIPSDIVDCVALEAALMQRHGATETSGFGSTAIYNWEDNGDTIRFTNSPEAGFCNLNYGAS